MYARAPRASPVKVETLQCLLVSTKKNMNSLLLVLNGSFRKRHIFFHEKRKIVELPHCT